MGLTLVYIGAAAGLVPAASLRALSGGGAVVVPRGLDADLLAVVEAAAGGGRLEQADPGDEAALAALADRAGREPLAVAVAGHDGPRLARRLRERLPGAATVPDGPAFDDALLGQELVALKRIVDVLRVECPWDREQTPRDIVSYTVEEVHELADAVARGDSAAEHGELGDLLLQVVLLALMLAEEGAGDLATVAHDIREKLVRRHPHIFAGAEARTAAEVKGRWERIKREQEGREGIFHDVPESFPALLYARKLQQRAASVGFDWPSALEAFPKIAEEHAELAAVLGPAAAAGDRRRLEHEVGDLLFAVVNVARLLRIDPELALRAAAQRFRARVTAAERLAAADGLDWSSLDLAAQEEYYQRAKADQGGGAAAPS